MLKEIVTSQKRQGIKKNYNGFKNQENCFWMLILNINC